MTKETKNILSMIILAVLIGLLSLTPLVAQTDFDTQQSQKEIEVMKSILSTSISLARKGIEGEKSVSSRRRLEFLEQSSGGVDGFYLYGQGVVFTIPYPCLSGRSAEEWEETMARLAELESSEAVNEEYLAAQMAFLESQIEMQRHALESMRIFEEGEAFFVAPAPPEPPEPPVAPNSGTGSAVAPQERVRDTEARKREIAKRVARMKDRLADSRQKSEESREKAVKVRRAIREELIRAVAMYGDSMTHIKDSEFINLIFAERCEPFDWNRTSARQTVLSIRKSDIRSYRSGQLTLEQLKGKFIEYQY